MGFFEYLYATGEYRKYIFLAFMLIPAYFADKLIKSKKEKNREKFKQELKKEIKEELRRESRE